MIRLPLTIALLALLAAVPAHAARRGSSSENNGGLYIGGSWGQFDLGLSGFGDLGDGFSDVFKSEDNIWRAFAGYRFNQHFSVEAAYVNYGDHPAPPGGEGEDDQDDEDNASSGYIPAVVLTIPDGRWELFGKVGYYLYSGESDFMYGMGFGYNFRSRFNLSFDYELVDVPGEDKDALWLNGTLRF